MFLAIILLILIEYIDTPTTMGNIIRIALILYAIIDGIVFLSNLQRDGDDDNIYIEIEDKNNKNKGE